MIKVFLSHSSTDKDYVRGVFDYIGEDNCVFDEATFENGMKTMDEIAKGIDSSALFVFFISDASLNSAWVKDELSKVRDYIDEGRIQFMPIIIDQTISHSDPRIKMWIRSEYNIKYYHSQIIAARHIQEILRKLAWKLDPYIRSKELLFKGREEELGELNRLYYDGQMNSRRCIVISGFPPGVGRKRLLTEYIRKELAKSFNENYEPITIELSDGQSIEDLLFQLNDITLLYSHSDMLTIAQKDKKSKVDAAVAFLTNISEMKEYVVIRDNGACILSNGFFAEWFRDILTHENLPKKICLLLTSRSFLNRKTETQYSSVLSLHIKPLNRENTKVLAYAYANLINVDINPILEPVIKSLPGIPAFIYRSVDIIKRNHDLSRIKTEINDLLVSEERSYVSVINTVKQDEDCYQALILITQFDFVSFNIIEDVLRKAQPDIDPNVPLEKLYSYSLYEIVGEGNSYVRANVIIKDYISRYKIQLKHKYQEALDEVLKEYINKGEVKDDLSGYLYNIQQYIKKNPQKVNQGYLIPSFTLKAVIDEYSNRHYKEVVTLCDRFLNDRRNYFGEIIRDIRYWLCCALCRLKNERFYKEVNFFKGYSKYFLLGFYNRWQKNYNQAYEYYSKALQESSTNHDKNYVAKAKHEMVMVQILLKDYSGALETAKENYETQPLNKYHVEAYYKCLLRERKPDVLMLKKLLGEFHTLILDARNQVIYDTLDAEYDYYINHDLQTAIRKLSAAIKGSDEAIRYYPYNALSEISRKIDAPELLKEAREKYPDQLEQKDDEE